MSKTKEQYLEILSRFPLEGTIGTIEPFGNGHINDTLKVTNNANETLCILQRINHQIFTNVDMLQGNIDKVTKHIRKKLEARGEKDIDRKVLTFLPTLDGQLYYFDGESYWRVCLSRVAGALKRSHPNFLLKPVKPLVIFNSCWPICQKVR